MYHWMGDDEEEEDQAKCKYKDKDNEKRMPQTNPRFFMVKTLTLQPSKPSITEHFSKRPSVTPEMEECRCNTITALLGHEDQNKDTLEDID